MRYIITCILVIIGSDASRAMLPTEPGNRVSFGQAQGLNFQFDAVGPIQERAELELVHQAKPNFPFGQIEAHGIADYGVLKLKGLLTGTGLGGYNLGASSVDLFTINNPAKTVGTAGTITAYIRWDGSARALDENGDSVTNVEHPDHGTSHVRASLAITQNQFDPTGSSDLHVDTDIFFPATDGVVISPQQERLLASEIHFEYGVPFPLQISMGIQLRNGIIVRGPVMGQFSTAPSRFYDDVAEEVEANFFNTATLFALVGDENNQVTAASDHDYQALVTNVHPSPVPLPSSILLLLPVFGLLCRKIDRQG